MTAGRELKRASAATASFWVAFGLLVSFVSSAKCSEKGLMQLTSTAFSQGETIQAKYTCDGENLSPPLKWSGAPSGVKSFAVIADDPDAPVGTWVHWVAFDLQPTTTELSEGLPKSQFLPGGAKQGLNDFKHLGYGGPCPPPGKAHRYFFKLYALDSMLDLKPGATKKEVERVIEKRTLAQGELMGLYKRK